MIEITPTITFYPLWPPHQPSFFWWRTRVSLICLILIRRRYWKKTHQKAQEQRPDPIPQLLTKEERLDHLLSINTSIRTPEQKANALLAHLFLYCNLDEWTIGGITLQDIALLPEAKNLLPFFQTLYSLLYTKQHITHSRINILVQSIVSHIQWI